MIRKQALTKFNFTKGGNKIKYIVIHFTGNKNDTANGNAKYFSQDGRNASAHYFIDKTECVQVVSDLDKAWHVGDGKGKYNISNSNSIGIEMCGDNGDISATTEANTLILVKELMQKYNVSKDRIVRHYDASRKNCPAPFNNDGKWTRWNSFKAKI